MDNQTLADELQNPWQNNHTDSERGPLPDWCFGLLQRAAAALRTPAPAPVGGEPVAYRFDHEWDGPDFGVQPLTDAAKAAGWTETPLYAAAQAQPEPAQGDDAVERVAFAIIEGSAGTRAAEHAKEFQTANWTDACRSARAALAAMQQAPVADDVRELVKDAYIDGATAVHDSWVAGSNGREPDFGEASSDYAAQAIERLPTQPQADAAVTVERERERCAKVAETMGDKTWPLLLMFVPPSPQPSAQEAMHET